MTAAVLHREAFRTSRLLEFCNKKELTAQTGHAPEEWPAVILKELVDNALDAAEEANRAPEIEIKVSTKTGEIVAADNGPGIPEETVNHVLDYSVRVSSREAYVSPTRGAQGNALKTIVAMPFALDRTCGDVVIEAGGVSHRIGLAVDQLRQEPRIIHERGPSDVKGGTCVRVNWPDSACSILEDAKERFLQIAEDFAWLNPHTRVRVEWNSVIHIDQSPSDPGWKKWGAHDPTSAHWYDLARLERYIAAHVSHDRDGRARTVRDFITEFRGFSGSGKQKVVLEETGMARASLCSLFGAGGEPKHTQIEILLDALKKHSKPVKPGDLGLIGRDHLLTRFKETGVDERTFKYQKVLGGADDGLPWVVETAFGYRPKGADERRIIAGVNWSVGIGNPFRSFGQNGEGLESILTQQRAGAREPIVFVLHFACPRIEYTDRGKSAIVIPGGRQ